MGSLCHCCQAQGFDEHSFVRTHTPWSPRDGTGDQRASEQELHAFLAFWPRLTLKRVLDSVSPAMCLAPGSLGAGGHAEERKSELQAQGLKRVELFFCLFFVFLLKWLRPLEEARVGGCVRGSGRRDPDKPSAPRTGSAPQRPRCQPESRDNSPVAFQRGRPRLGWGGGEAQPEALQGLQSRGMCGPRTLGAGRAAGKGRLWAQGLGWQQWVCRGGGVFL